MNRLIISNDGIERDAKRGRGNRAKPESKDITHTR